MKLFDTTRCVLGEGPLWHPQRQTLFWFDILGKRMMARRGADVQEWQFDEHVSAAGWLDETRLFLASETAFWDFDLVTGQRQRICALDADNPLTRSNDGRADPWGGFWIGTMGHNHERGIAAIHRYFRGEVRQLFDGITVSNAICFSPDRRFAYFTDTPSRKVMRVALEAASGWPSEAPEVFADLRTEKYFPDGAVTDAEGTLWIAIWGSGCVIALAPDGRLVRRIEVPARQPTCPAFGGPDFRDLYLTSARVGLTAEDDRAHPENGATFVLCDAGQGLPEPRVIL